jgi:hypothetical protein
VGLAERRAAEKFRNDDYPAWKARIDQAAGFEVPIEVNWEELAVDGYAGDYPVFFPRAFFEPLAQTLGAIAADDMGKSALRAGLSKVIIRNTNEHGGASGISFAGRVLTFDHKPQANNGDGDELKKLRKVLESGL